MSNSVSHMVDAVPDEFPKGLRVLVVDDDIVTLKMLDKKLQICHYYVKTCSHAAVALNLLRDTNSRFDVVLSDVHMPDMDGFKLLELIGLEMDLPVIMMSVDSDTNTVMRGIKHGACNYLIKPIRQEELMNIWQHVVRKKIESKEPELSNSFEDGDRHKKGSNDTEYDSSVNDGTNVVGKTSKKRKEISDEDDGELLNDDPTTSKKPRVVWSVELHQQFVAAVNQLGVDKAVPKKILEMMNVPGLTRENVASHLQKFRLYLKRLSQPHGGIGIPNSFGGSMDSNLKLSSSVGRFELQALAASGQIPSQTLAALQAGIYSHQPIFPTLSQPNHEHHTIPYGHPLLNPHSNIPKPYPHSIYSSPNLIDNNMLVTPSRPLSLSFENQNHNQNPSIDCTILSPNSSLCMNQGLDGNVKSAQGVLTGYSPPNPIPRFIPPKPLQSFNGGSQVLDQGPLRNLGSVGKGTYIPSCFGMDESLIYDKIIEENEGAFTNDPLRIFSE